MITIIDRIPFGIQPDQIYPVLRIEPGSRFAERFDALLKVAAEIARPKVACQLSAVDQCDAGVVELDGVCFQSKILQVNLQDCQRAFPFIATCGTELGSWAQTLDNTMEAFWANTINTLALEVAMNALKNHIRSYFQTGQTSTMVPGALADWPLAEQHKLFAVMGEAGNAIGVTLTQRTLMTPIKSLAGIEFESSEQFYSCQLCPRDKCPDRRACYDERLFSEYMRL